MDFSLYPCRSWFLRLEEVTLNQRIQLKAVWCLFVERCLVKVFHLFGLLATQNPLLKVSARAIARQRWFLLGRNLTWGARGL